MTETAAGYTQALKIKVLRRFTGAGSSESHSRLIRERDSVSGVPLTSQEAVVKAVKQRHHADSCLGQEAKTRPPASPDLRTVHDQAFLWPESNTRGW